jgi:2-iminobutanoate/2-iminopropanoate deaminase
MQQQGSNDNAGRTLINPSILPARGPMSWAVQANGLIFVSGIVSMDAEGKMVGVGDPEKQANHILDVIEAILAEAGVGLSSILRLTCYATSVEAGRAYVAARAKRVPGRPAATTVVVDKLLGPDMLLEVEVIASATA